MAEQDKKLLLKDLCARLPYKTRCLVAFEGGYKEERQLSTSVLALSQLDIVCVVKPYLRPMESMTEEEMAEYATLQDRFLLSSQYPVTDAYEIFDWLNAHHFDYRGLAEKGLVLEAPKGMY